MIYLSIVWLVFAVIFLTLGCHHWKMKGKNISYLQVKGFEQFEEKAQANIMGVDFADFVKKFNQYVGYYNEASKKEHWAQAIGYWVASATSLFSFALALVSLLVSQP